jgi:hypothetical protein
MTQIPYLFNQSTEQIRRVGARGGRATARNRRARQQSVVVAPPETSADGAPPPETTRQAMALLDAQFAWLRGAEKSSRYCQSRRPECAHLPR